MHTVLDVSNLHTIIIPVSICIWKINKLTTQAQFAHEK